MSTNDTVTVLASGASGITPSLPDFTAALTQACTDLAMQLLADAEGADHEIAITVQQRRHRGRRRRGRPQRGPQQPVQGRGLRQRPQLGPGARLDRHHRRRLRPGRPRRRHERRLGCRHSTPAADPADRRPHPREVTVTIDLKAGDERATVWTNDLTHAYVHENCAYSLMSAHRPRGPPRARQGRTLAAALPVAEALPRQDRRGEVRRQRHDRRRPQARLRRGHRLPAVRRASSPSSCTAAARRSRRCSTGSASSRSSGAACGSPPRRPWTSSGWCSSARSSASSSG